jgi:hypothetical protein
MRTKLFGKRLMAGGLVAGAAAIAVTVPASPASAQVAGRDVVTVNTTLTSDNKSITANCDSGQRVIGGSAWLVRADGDVRIVDMIPRTDYLYAFAREDEDGTNASWQLFASAVCADPIPGMDIVERTSTVTSDPWNSVAADCTGGDQLLGTGYRVNDGNGQVGLDDLKVTSSTRLTVWAYEDGTGYGSNWSVTAFAVCAPAPAGLEIVSEESTGTSDDTAALGAFCPNGKITLGGGGQVDGGGGQVIIDDLYKSEDEYRIRAYEDDDGTNNVWHLHAYAICANEF